jgi:hypothetical protein
MTRWRPHLDPLEERTLLSLTTFSVDDTQSFLTLSGNAFGQALQEQRTGSLTTAYTGTFQADVDFPNRAITFLFMSGNNGIMAENSDNWQPLHDGSPGAEPANYGGQINVFGLNFLVAIRNMDLKLSSEPLPLTPSGDGVSYGYPNSQHIKTHGGRAAFNYGPPQGGTKGFGRLPAADNQADSRGNASYLYDFNGDGSSLELYLSIDFSITTVIHRVPVTFNLDGVIVATGSLGVVGPTAPHATKDSDAVLGPALLIGTHTQGQPLVANRSGNLDNTHAPSVQPMTVGNPAPPSAGLDSAHAAIGHQAAVDLLDAVFAELNPIEHGTI